MIKVKSGLTDNRVSLWERHPAHPGGEAFVAGDRVVEVEETPQVKARLKSGQLVEVKPKARPKKVAPVKKVAAPEEK